MAANTSDGWAMHLPFAFKKSSCAFDHSGFTLLCTLTVLDSRDSNSTFHLTVGKTKCCSLRTSRKATNMLFALIMVLDDHFFQLQVSERFILTQEWPARRNGLRKTLIHRKKVRLEHITALIQTYFFKYSKNLNILSICRYYKFF